MRMYKCVDCGAVFRHPEIRTVYEHHTEIDPPNIETVHEAICPECGGDYILDGYACERCGDGFTEYDFCDECLDELDAYLENDVQQAMGITWSMLVDMLNELLERMDR